MLFGCTFSILHLNEVRKHNRLGAKLSANSRPRSCSRRLTTLYSQRLSSLYNMWQGIFLASIHGPLNIYVIVYYLLISSNQIRPPAIAMMFSFPWQLTRVSASGVFPVPTWSLQSSKRNNMLREAHFSNMK